MEPLVYIITLNWNGYDDTVEFLESLSHITYKNYQVVVVDNGSVDNQAEKIKKAHPSIHLIKNAKNRGYVVGNNQGIDFALAHQADYLLLINNDTVVSPDFLQNLVAVSESSLKAGIISPKILYYQSDTIWSLGGKMSQFSGIPIMIGKGENTQKYSDDVFPDFATGCAVLIKAEVLKTVGTYDSLYFAYYEDVDLSARIKKAGYQIQTTPNSIIWHKKSATAGFSGSNKISPLQSYFRSRNSIIYCKKNIANPVTRNIFLFSQLTINFLLNLKNCKHWPSVKMLFLGTLHGLQFYFFSDTSHFRYNH